MKLQSKSQVLCKQTVYTKKQSTLAKYKKKTKKRINYAELHAKYPFFTSIKNTIDVAFNRLIRGIVDCDWTDYLSDELFGRFAMLLRCYQQTYDYMCHENPQFNAKYDNHNDIHTYNDLKKKIDAALRRKRRFHSATKENEKIEFFQKWTSALLVELMDDSNYECQPLKYVLKEIMTKCV